MGQYKVPQDVEAEDKIIGQYTLKQFIYAIIGVAYGFLTFRIFFSTLPLVFLFVGVPPTILMLMLGLYRRKDQPFEALFLALVSFWTKPRQRLWIKEPITEVFKIVQPPIKDDVNQKNPGEVRSQLEHVAQIIDTRGVNTSEFDEDGNPMNDNPLLDLEERLIEPSLVASRDIGREVDEVPDMLSQTAVPIAAVSSEAAVPPTQTASAQPAQADIIAQVPPPTDPSNQTLAEGQPVTLRNNQS